MISYLFSVKFYIIGINSFIFLRVHHSPINGQGDLFDRPQETRSNSHTLNQISENVIKKCSHNLPFVVNKLIFNMNSSHTNFFHVFLQCLARLAKVNYDKRL